MSMSMSIAKPEPYSIHSAVSDHIRGTLIGVEQLRQLTGQANQVQLQVFMLGTNRHQYTTVLLREGRNKHS